MIGLHRAFARIPVRAGLLLVALGSVVVLGACGWFRSPEPRFEIAGADIERGRSALIAYGCVACHTVPGVAGPNTYVGPPLDAWAERRYIAGRVANNPDNLIEWIRFPQAIDPETAMPSLAVSEQDARDIAAYLYTLD